MTIFLVLWFVDAMRGLHERFRSTFRSLPCLLGMFAVVYFGYHAIQGENGMLAIMSLEQQIERAEAERVRLSAVEQRLLNHVTLLNPPSIDRDILDEQARRTLNLAHPHELVIMRSDDAAFD